MRIYPDPIHQERRKQQSAAAERQREAMRLKREHLDDLQIQERHAKAAESTKWATWGYVALTAAALGASIFGLVLHAYK